MIGNKTAEKDIRDYLSEHGYFGNSARFSELEIHAIGRPGWLQVFRFGVEAKTEDDQWLTLFGAMKDDERFKLHEIELFDNINRRDHLLKQWSEGLMQPRFKSEGDVSFGPWRYAREFLILSAVFVFLFYLLLLPLEKLSSVYL